MTSIKQYSSRYWLFKWKGLLHRQISTYSHCYRINSKYLKMISRYKPDTEKKNMYGTLFLVQNTNMCIYSNNHKNLCHPEPIHPHSGCACTIIKTYFIVSETFFFCVCIRHQCIRNQTHYQVIYVEVFLVTINNTNDTAFAW